MIEIEKTFLAKFLPEDLKRDDAKEVIDIYIPESLEHPNLRLRKQGEIYSLTRKTPINENDISKQDEDTIFLSEEEYETLGNVKGKRLRKYRYPYVYDHWLAEIDIFQDELKGLVLVDFEFESEIERDLFMMPDFCLAEVTNETLIAGGMLAGKSYCDISQGLEKYRYKKII